MHRPSLEANDGLHVDETVVQRRCAERIVQELLGENLVAVRNTAEEQRGEAADRRGGAQPGDLADDTAPDVSGSPALLPQFAAEVSETVLFAGDEPRQDLLKGCVIAGEVTGERGAGLVEPREGAYGPPVLVHVVLGIEEG